ncbi:MAG: ATP-grasp domain-containing protein [Eubacterium sp.]|nr:ATP-grasp domain-containing protein [Eubacterium sp.]
MHAWLMYDSDGAVRNRDYIDYHYDLGRELGIGFDMHIIDELTIDRLVDYIADEHPDVAIVRTICPKLNRILESEGVVTHNSYRLSYITNDKKRCIGFIMDNTDVPCVPCKETMEPGDVIKPLSGHGGIGVRRATESGSVPDGHVCQPFIDGPHEDVRVYVIGKRIVAAVKRTAPKGEFRANASLGGMTSRYELRERDRDYVEQIINVIHDGLIGIDFIIDSDGRFVFSEIEDVVGARMLYKTHPEIDILREYLVWITENY